jgi:NitT/TauT family transport system permease protein
MTKPTDVRIDQIGEEQKSKAPLYVPPRARFLEVRGSVSRNESMFLGLIGVIALFGIWELFHYMTPESRQKFLPSVPQVVGKVISLITEKNYIQDIGKSVYRIYASFAVACLVAVPLGLFMGSFVKLRALINPTVGGLRYLPAASFVPLLLVYFGPTDFAK